MSHDVLSYLYGNEFATSFLEAYTLQKDFYESHLNMDPPKITNDDTNDFHVFMILSRLYGVDFAIDFCSSFNEHKVFYEKHVSLQGFDFIDVDKCDLNKLFQDFDGKRFKCMWCPRMYLNKDGVRKHCRKEHPKEISKVRVGVTNEFCVPL